MPDLGEMLEQAAAAPSEPLDVAMLSRRVTRRRRIRHAGLACGAAAAVVAVVAGGIALRGGGSERTVAESPDTVPAEPGWSAIDPGPLDGRDGAAVVWTGSEVIVWGGHGLEITTTTQGNPSFDNTGEVRVEGAAYNPATDTWRTLASAPIDARVDAAAVWTGSEMVVWGGLTPDRETVGPDGAAYSPDTDTWRVIGDAPLSSRVPAAHAWTGTEMIVWRIAGRGTALADGAAYNPDTDTWRAIAPAPLTLNLASAAWAGDEMVIVGSRINEQIWPVDQQGQPIDGATTGARAMAYDPDADTWRLLPDPDLSAQAMFAVADGDTVVAWDFGLKARRLNPALDAWQRLPDLPIEAMDCYPSGHAHAGRVLAILCNQAALLDPEGTQWEALELPEALAPPGPVHVAVEVWTGTELILWGLDGSTEPAEVVGLRYHPEPEPSDLGVVIAGEASPGSPPVVHEGDNVTVGIGFLDGTRLDLTIPEAVGAHVGEVQLAGSVYAERIGGRGWSIDVVPGSIDELGASGEPVSLPDSSPATAARLDRAEGRLWLQFGSWVALISLELDDHAEVEFLLDGVELTETRDGFIEYQGSLPLWIVDSPDASLGGERGSFGGPVSVFFRDCSEPLSETTPTGLTFTRADLDEAHGSNLVVPCDTASRIEIWLDTAEPLSDDEIAQVDVELLSIGSTLSAVQDGSLP